MRSIKCKDCSAKRSNPRFKNTLYCKACRLLRDLLYVEAEQRPCDDCNARFAPVSRRDLLCGACCYGSIYEGHCIFCDKDAELHRDGVAVCTRCVRDPKLRGGIIAALRKGQRQRRLENAHV